MRHLWNKKPIRKPKVIQAIKYAALSLGLTVPIGANADVTLPQLFSDGMVLQRGQPIAIWGFAKPGEKVTVALGEHFTQAATNHEGKWAATLPAMPASGPMILNVKGVNQLTVKDVFVGDVWLASGQSNMELTLARAEPRYPDVVADANNRYIRQFEVPDRYHFKGPKDDLDGGAWLPATKEHIRQFSAVGYFFAQKLYQEQNVAIGIINAALGGSPVEAWMSAELLKPLGEPYAQMQKFMDDDYIKEVEASDQARSNKWYGELGSKDLGVKNSWQREQLNTRDWQTAEVPGYWKDTGVATGEGVVWYRKTLELPQRAAGKEGLIVLGAIIDADEVFINGKKVGVTYYMYPPRRYNVPAGLLKAGNNTIAVRMTNVSGLGGFVPEKDYALYVSNDRYELAGTWLYKRGATMEPLASQTFVRWKPAGLFNGLIAPLIPYGIKGVIWYQGESNAGDYTNYPSRFNAMVGDWRERWGYDFPFIYVQLANYVSPGGPKDERGNWADMRDAQRASLAMENTAMVVTADIGEWNDIHPLDKKTVGERLALAAGHLAYNQQGEYSGPHVETAQRKGKQAIIQFSHSDGLVAKGDTLQGFELAGQDGIYHPATAEIDGSQIIVKSKKVKRPAFVRYGWYNNPEMINLYNSAGLPASPFSEPVN